MSAFEIKTFQDKQVALAILGKMQKRHPDGAFALVESASGFTLTSIAPPPGQAAEPKTALEAIASITVGEAAASFKAHLAANPPATAPEPKPVKPTPAKPKVKWKPELGYYSGVSFKLAAPYKGETPTVLSFEFNGQTVSVNKSDLVGHYVEGDTLSMKMSAAFAKKKGFLK
jgi:hypothetical protein